MSYSITTDDFEDDEQVVADFPPSIDEYQKTSRVRRERGRRQKAQKHHKQNSKPLRGRTADMMFIDDGWWN